MDNPAVDVVSEPVFTIKVSDPEVQDPPTKQNRPELDLELHPVHYRTYRKRWLILFLFVFYSASNSSQWIQYAIIANIVSKYYSVASVLVDWTSMIFMVTYIPLIFPASYLIELKGLRFTTLIGAFGTCAGSWIKVFSVSPDLFWLTFIGQTVVAVSQVFVLSVPARLAAVWFGPNELGSACSIGVFGNQLGIAVGFVLPPMLVKNSINLDEIGQDLEAMFLYFAIFTSVLFILIIFWLVELVPNEAQKSCLTKNQLAWKPSIKKQ